MSRVIRPSIPFGAQYFAFPREESPKQFLEKVANLLNELIPGIKPIFIQFVTKTLTSIVMKHSKSSSKSSSKRSSTTRSSKQKKKSGGYKWRNKSVSRKSVYSRRQSGGNFIFSQYDANAIKFFVICILSLYVMRFTAKNILFPAIPAHDPLFVENITVSTVMDRLPAYVEWKDFIKMPEITAGIARLEESFVTISKRKEFQQKTGKSHPDVSSAIFSTCETKHNPIIEFIDFTAVSLSRGEYYCRNSNHADFEACMNALFRSPNNNPSDLSVSFTRPRMSPHYDEGIKIFINTFYNSLEQIIKEYKTNEAQYHIARNPAISSWNYSMFGLCMIALSISAYNLYINGLKSIELTRENTEAADKLLADAADQLQKFQDSQNALKRMRGY